MNEVKLNLARKWRSKNFNEIVGQDLPVRMLKNSLYRQQYFPVYLFSGQRGCGKTTTARVFAMALNCALLKKFQEDPQSIVLPCLQCESCVVALSGKHPDFIEIDAASHTGVDNVRQIVDAASYLPVLGSKKIYLIDEAHMLSKAAFNALLKILEEPPQSTLFILATTDLHKIIDTVQSRCFQLFFSPIANTDLLGHLQNVCQTEEILFEDNALSLIVQESEGSARDALNLLEQVRFSTGLVTKQAVLQVLGHLDDEQVLALFEAIALKWPADVLRLMKNIDFGSHDPEFVWQRLLDLIRALLWVKHGITPIVFAEHGQTLTRLAAQCSFLQLNTMLEIMCSNENAFQRAAGKSGFFEIIILQMCKKNIPESDSNSGTSCAQSSASPMQDAAIVSEQQDDEDEEQDDEPADQEEREEVVEIDKNNFRSAWDLFVKDICTLNDPLVASVITQGTYLNFDPVSGKLDIEFSSELAFFKTLLEDTHKVWSPFLQTKFERSSFAKIVSLSSPASDFAKASTDRSADRLVQLHPLFTGASQKKLTPQVPEQTLSSRPMSSLSTGQGGVSAAPLRPASQTQVSQAKTSQANVSQAKASQTHASFHAKPFEKKQEKAFTPFNNNKYAGRKTSSLASQSSVIDISDIAVWQTAHMIMRHFPGTVREIRE